MTYTLTRSELSRLKSRLTKAVKTGSLQKIKTEASYAYGVFDEKGWPDCHGDWERALFDAEMKQAFGTK